MWFRIEKHPLQVKYGVNDFRKIYKSNGERISIEDFNELHNQSLKYLEAELAKNTEQPKIVLTHHLPSLQCNDPIYEGSTINETFSTDLDALILRYHPKFWIYGHSHGNMAEIQIGSTKLINNQMDYVQLNEHQEFKKDAFLEL